jgi:threonyl-tRNA synthetase
VTVTDGQIPYGEKVHNELLVAGIRVEKDFRNEKLGYKIREAQMQKIPFMLVIGDKEVESATVTPRWRDGKNLEPMNLEAFISLVREKCSRYE